MTKVYLKKFVCKKNGFEKNTTDASVAKKWIASKENVDILFNDGSIETFRANIKRIILIGKTPIIWSTYPYPLKVIGIDDKVRKMYSPHFYHITKKEYISLEQAKQCVENGEEIQAITPNISTSPIKRFVADNKFLTRSYSLYEIC